MLALIDFRIEVYCIGRILDLLFKYRPSLASIEPSLQLVTAVYPAKKLQSSNSLPHSYSTPFQKPEFTHAKPPMLER